MAASSSYPTQPSDRARTAATQVSTTIRTSPLRSPCKVYISTAAASRSRRWPLNLNQFARRSTSAGSMYGYSVMGLGTTAGNIAGWCLVWAYLFIGTAGMTGFTIFATTLLGMADIHVPQLALFILCAGSIWYLGYKDIRLSSG